jgi:hypothetical protein
MANKRRKGQELGKRRVPAAFDSAGSPQGHTHSECLRVQAIATALIQQVGKHRGMSTPQMRRAVSHLPKLLCSQGQWPPKGLPLPTAKFISEMFTLACIQTGVTGMRGQNTEWYPRVVQLARKHEAELGVSIENDE